MTSFEMSEWIKRPPQEVFDFLSNPPNAAEYIENIKEGHKVSDGPVGVGTVFSETRVVNNREASAELVVTAYDPPRTFGISNETMGVEIVYTYTLDPEKGGTRVTWVCDLEASGLKRMMLPMVAGIMKKEDGDHLQNVKQVLENR